MHKFNATGKLTLSAVFAAFSVVLLLISSVLPGVQLSFMAVATGIAAALVIVYAGLSYGILTVAATTMIAFLLVPSKGLVLLYAVFFGPYAILKNLIEQLHHFFLEWGLKLVYCGIISVLLMQFFTDVLELMPDMISSNMILYFPAVLFGFVIYDIVFSKLIAYFCQRIHIG